MARYLVYTSPARGHLYPLVPTLDELRQRGHEVAVRTLSSEVEMVEGLGFSAAPIAAAVEGREHDDWRARTPVGALRRTVRAFADRAEDDLPDLQRAIDEERPDALWVDINCWGAGAAAEASGLRWALFCPYFLHIPSAGIPPYGPGLAPRRGRLGALRDRALRPLIFTPLERMAMPPINAIRERLGLPVRDGFTALMAAVPLLVYFTSEPPEYPRSDWPAGVRMVGPGIWEPPAEPPPWLDEIDPPLVLVTASTEFQDDGKLIAAALEALRDEDVRVVATTAGVDPSGFTAPANARVERFVPHGPLVARAACVVCHGGMGITQKALAAGVPVCVVPFGRDQLEVARRVQVAGAGTRVSAAWLRPGRLAAAVRKAIEMKPGAERVAASFAGAGGPVAAADALEDLQ